VNDDGLPSNQVASTWTVVSGPGAVTIAAATSLATTATFATTGTYVLRLSASDGALSASDDLTVHVWNNPDGNGPTVALNLARRRTRASRAPWPSPGRPPTQIFLEWLLEMRPVGGTDWTLIKRGTTSVSGATFATFDPTLLENGLYELRLTAEDLAKQTASTAIGLTVDGNQKVGNFTSRSKTSPCLLQASPSRSCRTYDSRNKQRGDFGVGWRA